MALRKKKKSTASREHIVKQSLYYKTVAHAEAVNSAAKAGCYGLPRCWKEGGRAYLRHVGQPVQDSEHPFKVITDSAVGHPIVVHDLDAPELVIGGVYFPSEDLEK